MSERVRMNPVDTAKYVGCSYGKLMSMKRHKEIPFVSIGNRVFFFQDTLDRWLENLESLSMQPEKLKKAQGI